MKSIMLCVTPEELNRILFHDADIIVKRVAPKHVKYPYKVYLYCTQPKKDSYYLGIYRETSIGLNPGSYGWYNIRRGSELSEDKEDLCGKVVGEFICHPQTTIHPALHGDDYEYLSLDFIERTTTFSRRALRFYGKGRKLHCYHMTDFIMYPRSKSLDQFYKLSEFGWSEEPLTKAPTTIIYVKEREIS